MTMTNTAHDLQNASVESLMPKVADEFIERLNRGEHPDIEEYASRYPQIATFIRQMFPALELLHLPSGHPEGIALGEAEAGEGVQCLGDFRILHQIGRGGMGIVYQAEQVSLGRRVALKLLPFAGALDPKQLQRFKNEAQAAAHLHHTNIVPVYYVGCDRGVHYYAMQLIEGETLAALIGELRQAQNPESRKQAEPHVPLSEIASNFLTASTSPAPPSVPALPAAPSPRSQSTPEFGTGAGGTEAASTVAVAALTTERSTKNPAFFRTIAKLGIQAAQALEHAHEMGVIHRDIKPGNLMLDGRSHLWVTDFGLAQFNTEINLTVTGDMVGTLRYMSPEQADAHHAMIDHRTDIYSLGVTLYELLTLEPAVTGRDRQEILRRIAVEEPKKPRGINRAIPAELDTVVLKAIEKNPADRYTTAQELADDLDRFLKHEPIRARRPSIGQRLRKWSRRHRGVLATALAVSALALMGLVLGLFWHNRQLGQAAERERDLSTKAKKEAERPEELAAKAKEENERAQAVIKYLLEDLLGQAAPEQNPRQKKVTVEEVLDKAAAKVDKAFAGRPDLEAAVRLVIGQTYGPLGLHERAQPQLERALALNQERLGPEHSETMTAVEGLAVVLLKQEKLAEAEPLLRQNLEARRRVLGPEHPNTLVTLHNQARLLFKQGKWPEAELLDRQHVEASRRVLGPDHPGTLIAVNSLAHTLVKRGKLADAEPLLRQNMEAYRHVRGPDHPDTQFAVQSLASLLEE